jgi:23S rRNA (adenine2503-C2)-methyltransferase
MDIVFIDYIKNETMDQTKRMSSVNPEVLPPLIRSTILGLIPAEINHLLKENGHPAYVGDQLLQWVYKHKIDSYDQMTNVSKAVRDFLESRYSMESLPIIDSREDASDGTNKVLFQLSDGESIESVVMPRFSQAQTNAQTGEVTHFRKQDVKNYTICVSTQVGCRYACRFCASGQMGFKRHLSAGEIVAQVMTFLRQGQKITHIVFMGMGEPLHNFEHLKKAIAILCDPKTLDFSNRHLTVSTVGLVPEIYRMASEAWKVKLAISLHATTDASREHLIPLAKSYQLDQLMDALRAYQRCEKRRLTFEYLMIDQVNDSPKDAFRLIKLAEGLHIHVNLIPYNTTPQSPYKPSTMESIDKFKAILRKEGKIDTTIRYSRGRNIDGACGQLRLRHR